jgi:hypothetical protein
MDASGPEWGPVAGSCEHTNEPLGSIESVEFLASWVTVSFSRRTLLHGVNFCGGMRVVKPQ